MGALTINRKRGNDFLSLNLFSSPCYSPSSSSGTELHVSKKPRVSFMQISEDKPVASVQKQNTVSRVRRYPEPTQRFVREVHAPCRKSRFSFSSYLVRETRTHDMGNFLSRQLEQAKSFALESFQHAEKKKEVINAEARSSKDVSSDDSSVEELEILDDGIEVEGRSVISEQRSLEYSGDKYLQEKYAKFADNNLGVTSSLISEKPKVDETGKMLETLSVNRDVEDMGVLPHKKLYESAERRNSRLGSLAFTIDLMSKKLSFFSRPSKKPEEDVLGELFTPLTDEEEAEVDLALSNSKRRKVLVTHENSNIEITGEMLQCLTPGAWLNDEVINVFLELLKERERREPKKFLKCHFFNTFFYKKLVGGRIGYDFKAVKRWTSQRKLGYGLIECDKIFVPIHKEIHWCLAVINKKEEKFQYLDSLRGIDSHVLKVLARYFMEEVKDKSSKDIDISSWKHEYVEDLPEQENGWDCGMFMIKYADFYSRGLGLCFNQVNVIDPADMDGLKSALDQNNVKHVSLQNLRTNPYLRCVDIELVSKLCPRKLHHVLGGALNPNAAYLIIRGLKYSFKILNSHCLCLAVCDVDIICDFLPLGFFILLVEQLGCYKEIYRVLKPGQCFATYEWCMIDSFDPSFC